MPVRNINFILGKYKFYFILAIILGSNVELSFVKKYECSPFKETKDKGIKVEKFSHKLLSFSFSSWHEI